MALITLEEFKAAREVSNSAMAKKFNPMVEDVQVKELIGRLGREFYYDIVENPSEAVNATLLTGGSYEYQDRTYINPGLKAVLIDFLYAHYKMFGSTTDTPMGVVQKMSQDSKQVDRSTLREEKKFYEQVAEQKWTEVQLFLNRNYSDYPLWRYGSLNDCPPARRTFGFSKIN